MYTIKKLFRDHSAYLLILTLVEAFISIYVTLAFVYTDSLTYQSSNILTGLGVDELLQTMYTSTWWALILFLLAFIVIFNLVTIIYGKLEFAFMSISSWVIMMILAINVGNPIEDIITKLLLFIPIIIINIVAYKGEKNKIEKRLEEKSKKENTTKEETTNKKTTKKSTTKKSQKNKASK